MSKTLDAGAIVTALNAYDGKEDWRVFARSLGLDGDEARQGSIPVGDGRVIRYSEDVRAWAVVPAETFEQRALRNLRQRHADGARRAAVSIQEKAAWILLELDRGQVPSHHLVDEAVELERRVFALDAIRDATGIWESAGPPEPVTATHQGQPVGPRRSAP